MSRYEVVKTMHLKKQNNLQFGMGGVEFLIEFTKNSLIWSEIFRATVDDWLLRSNHVTASI